MSDPIAPAHPEAPAPYKPPFVAAKTAPRQSEVVQPQIPKPSLGSIFRNAVKKVVAPRKNPFRGHIMFVWNAGNYNALSICKTLKRNGYSGVAIKSHDGKSQYISGGTAAAWRAACRRVGLDFGLWAYTRDVGDPFGEGRVHAATARAWGAEFFITDAEAEYEAARNPVSRLYCQGFRATYQHLPACLSSFGRIDLHNLDWRAWSDHHFGFMPQAYTVDSPRYLSPAACVRVASRVFAMRAIYPTISVKSDVNGYLFSPQTLRSQLRKLPTRGSSVWELSIARAGDIRSLAVG